MQNNETLAWNNENLNKSHHRSNSWSCSNFQPISWLLLKNPVSSIIHMPLLLVETYRISTENLIDACNPRLISNSKAYTGERKKKKTHHFYLWIFEIHFIQLNGPPACLTPMIHNHIQFCPGAELPFPVGNCGQRCNNQERTMDSFQIYLIEKRNGLDSLSQPHFIC